MLMADDEKGVSYFPIFTPYSLLIEAIVSIIFALKITGAKRKVEHTSSPQGHAGPVAVFISYRRTDTAYIVDRLSQTLAGEFGKTSVFWDLDSTRLGEFFDERIRKAVGNASVVLAVIGKEWLRDQNVETEGTNEDWVIIELLLAVKNNVPVIPVLVMQAQFPDERLLPSEIQPLTRINGLRLNPDPYCEVDLTRLVSRIYEILNSSQGTGG